MVWNHAAESIRWRASEAVGTYRLLAKSAIAFSQRLSFGDFGERGAFGGLRPQIDASKTRPRTAQILNYFETIKEKTLLVLCHRTILICRISLGNNDVPPRDI